MNDSALNRQRLATNSTFFNDLMNSILKRIRLLKLMICNERGEKRDQSLSIVEVDISI